VATTLPVAGANLTLWIPGQTLFASTSSYSSCIWSFHTENGSATCSFTHTIVFGCIIVVAQHMHCQVCDVTTVIDEQWQSTGRQKSSELYHRGEFIIMFEWQSRMCSQKPLRPFLQAVRFLYITWNNYFPTRSVAN